MNEQIEATPGGGLRLNTIDGITKMIEKLIGERKKPKDGQPEGPMLAVFEGVIEQIENYGGFDSGISQAMLRVRTQLGLPMPKQKATNNTTDEETA
jgi:hypothetical protein